MTLRTASLVLVFGFSKWIYYSIYFKVSKWIKFIYVIYNMLFYLFMLIKLNTPYVFTKICQCFCLEVLCLSLMKLIVVRFSR